MARISTYDQDSSLNKLDKLIGTDSATDGTKNFTISSLIQLINDLSAINMFDGLSYEYQAYDADATDPEGILNLTGTSLNNTAFSAINQIIISKKGHESPDVENYINALDGGRIKLSQQGDIDNFGIFQITNIQDYTNDRYLQLTVSHDDSNGTLTAGTRYHLSNYQASIDSNLSTRNVTEFGDVNNSGSGSIITTAERNIVTDALTHSDIVDNVTSTSANVPLSANQGRVLNGLISSINTLLTSDNVQLDTLQEVVDYIETNRNTLDTLAISNITGLQTALNGKQNTEAGKGLSANDFTTALLNKLNGIAANAEVNVNPDWNATTGDGQILNKPNNFIYTSSSATSLSDINSAGSGYIITDAERNSITSTNAAFIGLSSTERAKLTSVETNADVTDTTNVVAALQPGTNISIETDGTINATDTNDNTTYDLTVAQSGDNAQISLEGSDNVDDNITLVAGNNVDLTVNSGNTTIDVDLSTGAVADGATTLVTGDHVFDHTTNFARKDQNETFAGNVVIQGDLTVSGTQETVLSNEVNIGDAIITLNSDIASNAAPSENAGIDVNRGNASTVSIRWNEQYDAWQFTNDGTTYENINADHPLNDLTDVNITNLQNDQVLKYNSTTSKWENQTDAGGIALTDLSVGAEGTASGDGAIAYNNTTGVFTYTPPDLSSYLTTAVDGTGTAGTLPKMSDSDTITDSSISESGQVVTVDTTGAIQVPDGTTAQRPSTPVAGMFRYNTDDAQFEGYTTEWGAIAGSGGASTFNVDKISGDGTTSFTLGQSISDENNTQVYIDGVYQSKDNYSINGTAINFTTAPPTGTDNIEVVSVTSVALEDTNTLTRNSFTGNGSTTAYTLSVSPTNEDLTFVYIQGVYQEKSTYSISGSTITFTTAPQNGYTFEVMSLTAANITQTSYMASDSFSTPTQGQTSFTLVNGTPSNKSFTMVFISGVYQDKSTYSLTSGAIVLSQGVDAEDTVEVISIGNGGIIGSPVSDANDARYSVNVISANDTAVAGAVYVFTASLTLTLPASPEVGESIKISNRSGVETCVLGRNGNKILGAAADLTLDTASASFELIYSGTAQGWVIIGQ